MNNLTHNFLTGYTYFRIKAYRELNLVRALDEDIRGFMHKQHIQQKNKNCSIQCSCMAMGHTLALVYNAHGTLKI